jgi:hypothetical protein
MSGRDEREGDEEIVGDAETRGRGGMGDTETGRNGDMEGKDVWRRGGRGGRARGRSKSIPNYFIVNG